MISSLRILAATLCLAFHFYPDEFRFGHYGVDLFFLISGYLLTRRLQTNSGLVDFYFARLRRLVPAIAAMVAVITILCWHFQLDSEFTELSDSLVFNAAGIWNYFLAKNLGYFGPQSSRTIFLNLWSLAVEFQFCLVFPLLWKLKSSKKILTSIVVLTITSFAIFFIEARFLPLGSYYTFKSRFWEFGIGALLAQTMSIELEKPNESFLAFLGGASYSVYLWSWPLLSLENHFESPPSHWRRGILLVVILSVSFCSYRFLEKGLLKMKFSPKRMALLLLPLIVMAGIGSAIKSGLIQTENADKTESLTAALEDQFIVPKNRFDIDPGYYIFEGKGALKSEKVLVAGDSLIQNIFPRLLHRFPEVEQARTVYVISEGGCPPLRNAISNLSDNNCLLGEGIMRLLKKEKFDKVILIAAWNWYSTNGEWIFEKDLVSDLLSSVQEMQALDKKVVIVLPPPQGVEFSPVRAIKRDWMSGIQVQIRHPALQEINDRDQKIRSSLIEIGEKTSASILDPGPMICPDGQCRVEKDGQFKYNSRNHFRPWFSQQIPLIDSHIFDL